MTYFGFLGIFLGIPLVLFSLWTIYDFRHGKWLAPALASRPAWGVLLGLCLVAVLYTTPWDNYLVATRVWWYDPAKVAGIVLGYVPLEEYTFFILQPILTGLFLLGMMRYRHYDSLPADNIFHRKVSSRFFAILWLIACIILLLSLISASWKQFTYLSLELSWALIPILMQFALGADILWRHRRVVIPSILISTLYLSFADAVAIHSGIWMIDPGQSLNIFLGGILPLEEFVFFLLTNSLVVLGMTLVLAEESQARLLQMAWLQPILRRLHQSGDGGIG